MVAEAGQLGEHLRHRQLVVARHGQHRRLLAVSGSGRNIIYD
jgi:hypothetical protein